MKHTTVKKPTNHKSKDIFTDEEFNLIPYVHSTDGRCQLRILTILFLEH